MQSYNRQQPEKIPLSPASRSLTDKIPTISLLQELLHEGRLTH
jgi:hypothetical protein